MIEYVSRLPAGYQEVTHITLNGSSQYINTGIIPNGNTRLRLVFSNSDGSSGTAATTWRCIYGTRKTSGNNESFSLWKTSAAVFGSYYGATTPGITFPSTVNVTGEHTVIMDKNGTTIDGETVSHSSALTACSYPIYIGAVNTAGKAEYFSPTTVKELEIDDSPIVPCYRKSDGSIGLFELNGNVFCPVMGSGTVSKGDDVSGVIVVTAGGIIPQKYALRRRAMGRWAETNITVTLTGSRFYYSQNSYAEVVIGGITYNTAQTISIPKGTGITLRIQAAFLAGGDNDSNSRIEIDGEEVVVASPGELLITYEHTADTDCVIECFEAGTLYPEGTNLGLRLTT